MGNKRSAANRRGEVGRRGEDIAAAHLGGLGYVVLERNWRTRYGELDLIVADGDRLVVVEVKTRSTQMYSDAAEAVTPAKLARMRSLTKMWLAAQDRFWSEIRFDVIAVQLNTKAPPDAAVVALRHHRGVFV